MSSMGYSSEDLFMFLDMLGNKGLLNKATADARKTAAAQVLDILDDSEKQDLREIDVDGLFDRFQNLRSNRFTPTSLKTYKSRFNKGLEDFLKWKENPMSFKPSLASKKIRTKRKLETGASVSVTSESHAQIIEPPSLYKRALPSIDVFPIRIREDVVVQIAHLPHDLTLAEAKKIARVIQAHVLESEEA